MYRDIIGKPEKFSINNTEYWYQQVGDTVLLYDCNGEPIGEFESMEELEYFVFGIEEE